MKKNDYTVYLTIATLDGRYELLGIIGYDKEYIPVLKVNNGIIKEEWDNEDFILNYLLEFLKGDRKDKSLENEIPKNDRKMLKKLIKKGVKRGFFRGA